LAQQPPHLVSRRNFAWSSSWGLAKESPARAHLLHISGRSILASSGPDTVVPFGVSLHSATQMPLLQDLWRSTPDVRGQDDRGMQSTGVVPAAFAGVCSRRNVYRRSVSRPLLADAHIAVRGSFRALRSALGHVVPYDPQLSRTTTRCGTLPRAPVQPNRTRRLNPPYTRYFYTLYFATNAKLHTHGA